MSGDIEAMNALFERLGSSHRIAPGTLVGPDIALLFSLVLDRIEQLERRFGGDPRYNIEARGSNTPVGMALGDLSRKS